MSNPPDLLTRERVDPMGYINEQRQHVLIGVRNPALLNADRDTVQIAITIDTAILLRAELDAFLTAHGVTLQ